MWNERKWKCGNGSEILVRGKNLVDKKFDRLLVVKRTDQRLKGNKEYIWECLCDCGNIKYTNTGALTSKDTRSCGCLAKEMVGPKCPSYKPTLTNEERLIRRNTPENRLFFKKVFERDDYTCQICYQKSGKLNAHHLYNWADYPELRYDIDNGVTLCKRCHDTFHKIYGKKKNTKQEFDEFRNIINVWKITSQININTILLFLIGEI